MNYFEEVFRVDGRPVNKVDLIFCEASHNGIMQINALDGLLDAP